MIGLKIIFALLPWTIAFGQSGLIGSWTSTSVTIDGKTKELEKLEKYSRVQFTFDNNNAYIKTYHSPRINSEILYYKYFELRDDQIVHKPVQTEDGYPLKMLVMDKKIEKGTFELDSISGTLILIPGNKEPYKCHIELSNSQLTLIDKTDGLDIYIKLSLDIGRKKKRGSS